jgi:hypothetical protein
VPLLTSSKLADRDISGLKFVTPVEIVPDVSTSREWLCVWLFVMQPGVVYNFYRPTCMKSVPIRLMPLTVWAVRIPT